MKKIFISSDHAGFNLKEQIKKRFSKKFLFDDLGTDNSKKSVNVETLEKEIWQHSSDLDTHTVETHIYRLRKKIKAEFGNDELIKSNKDGYTI